MIKMFSEDLRFIVGTNQDVFTVKIHNDGVSVNYFLSDEEVRELQALCEYHLHNKVNKNEI